MATYDELLNATADVNLQNKIRFAVVVAAELIRLENPAVTNHAQRLEWARGVFTNPSSSAGHMIWAFLAQNRGFTAAQLAAATDTQVQTAVNAAVDAFAF
jgi:hypothetical protein